MESHNPAMFQTTNQNHQPDQIWRFPKHFQPSSAFRIIAAGGASMRLGANWGPQKQGGAPVC